MVRTHPRLIAGVLGLTFVLSATVPASNANANGAAAVSARRPVRALPKGFGARPHARNRASSAQGCTGTGLYSFVAVTGLNNYAGGDASSVLGGGPNDACQTYSSIGAGSGNIVSLDANGDGAYSFIGGGLDNAITETENFIGGGSQNSTSGEVAAVVGGSNNAAQGAWSTVVGGFGNTASGNYSSVAAGYGNQAEGEGSFIGSGGRLEFNPANTVSGTDSFIGSGDQNAVSGTQSFLAAGQDNQIAASTAFIGSGIANLITSNGTDSAIAGGDNNVVYSGLSFIGSGVNNVANGPASAVVSGAYNTAYSNNSFVGAGEQNSAQGNGSFIGAGGFIFASVESGHAGRAANEINGTDSFIGAGDQNFVNANDAFLGGGNSNNIASAAVDGSLAGGNSNDVTGQKATIGGGESNVAQGSFATVPGGYRNEALGNESFAAGSQAEARYPGSFVWSDYVSSEKPQVDSHAGEFVARASGGVYFFSNAASSAGVHLAAGSGSWSSLSDRNAKTDVAPMDDASTLAKVVALPVSTWRYKTESGVRHAGPMAQDFYAAFGVGEDDKHITSIDEDGVALSAIKALHTENRELRAAQRRLEVRDAMLERRLAALESMKTHR